MGWKKSNHFSGQMKCMHSNTTSVEGEKEVGGDFKILQDLNPHKCKVHVD